MNLKRNQKSNREKPNKLYKFPEKQKRTKTNQENLKGLYTLNKKPNPVFSQDLIFQTDAKLRFANTCAKTTKSSSIMCNKKLDISIE